MVVSGVLRVISNLGMWQNHVILRSILSSFRKVVMYSGTPNHFKFGERGTVVYSASHFQRVQGLPCIVALAHFGDGPLSIALLS